MIFDTGGIYLQILGKTFKGTWYTMFLDLCACNGLKGENIVCDTGIVFIA